MATFREPVHLFSIPPSIAKSLILRQGPGYRSVEDPASIEISPELGPSTSNQASSSLTCTTCSGATFADVNEQRTHFRSDWHRYNVKTRLHNSGAKPVTEAEFGDLVEALNDSLSGSASSSSEDDSESDDAVASLTHKTKKARIKSLSPSEDYSNQPTIPKSPITWFQSTSPSAPNTQLGIYTTLFPPKMEETDYSKAINEMQDGGENGRKWALFMTAGGHFAGMIVRVSKPGPPRDAPAPSTNEASSKHGKSKGGGSQKPQPEMQIIAHKTFHRYTTRRKQGGSQSVNDNAKGPAKSAGAQLRRYGEQALRDDIRALLVEWKDELSACDLIFIRASVSNRRTFLESEDSPIRKGDERLRTFPFQTRRPTLSELQRCLQELTRVKITRMTEEELRAADEAFVAFLHTKMKPKPNLANSHQQKASTVAVEQEPEEVISKEEKVVRERWRKLIEMVRKGRLEAFTAFWATLLSLQTAQSNPLESLPSSSGDKNAPSLLINTSIPDWLRIEESLAAGTLLQLAASCGQEQLTQYFLVELRADPTIPVPTSSSSTAPEDAPSEAARPDEADDDSVPLRQTASSEGTYVRKAYDLASTRGVRNVFRRTAYEHPDWYDWLSTSSSSGANLPSVLTPSMEATDALKKSTRRKGLKERMKERQAAEAETLARQEEEEQKRKEKDREEEERRRREVPTRGPQKLGGSAAATGASSGALAAMSPEMRARVERERRARAAEARLRTLGGGAT